MSPRLLLVAFVLAWFAAVIACAPATLLLSRMPASSGMAVANVRGTVWNARFDDVAVHGLALGNLRARLSPSELLIGRLRIRITGSRLSGDVMAGRRRGIAGIQADLVTQPSAALPGIALSIAVRDTTWLHTGGACDDARGDVRVDVRRIDTGAALVTLAGRPRCTRGGALLELVAVEAGAGALAGLRVAIQPTLDGQLDVLSTAPVSRDATAGVMLQAVGFTSNGQRWERRDRLR